MPGVRKSALRGFFRAQGGPAGSPGQSRLCQGHGAYGIVCSAEDQELGSLE